jgi:DJ-1 family protein
LFKQFTELCLFLKKNRKLFFGVKMDIRVLVPLAQGVEEMEAVTIIDLLRRSGMSVVVAGELEIVTCAHGVKIIPDTIFYKLEKGRLFDAIVLPGGSEGVHNLIQNEYISHFLRNHSENDKLLAAVCAAPLALAFHKVLQPDSAITSHPSAKNQLIGYDYKDDDVVVSNNIITSRGAGTTISFVLKIIETLASKEVAEQVAEKICYNHCLS